MTATPVSGMLAWGTTLHSAAAAPAPPAPNTPAGPFSITETAFSPATLSAAERVSIVNRCTNIIGNGSSFGICRSCRQGGLGELVCSSKQYLFTHWATGLGPVAQLSRNRATSLR